VPPVHEFSQSLTLPGSPEEVFGFFADAANLNDITPHWLGFRILTPLPIEMREGALIDYRIRLRGLPMRWRTRIEEWRPPHRFVDTQLRGPYSLWRHTHTFEATPDGTICRDHVAYAHHGGPLMERFFVRPEIERIFEYRTAKLQELLGERRRPPRRPHVSARPSVLHVPRSLV